ncbi:MAG: peptidyl-prolyl cis-trans isomerase [Candidatus Caldatribacteriota bacterium]|nr:peptidyl-prolyl cis-trans isomerase [Candidatus Caldatribacteriota bacterium]
MNKSMNIFRNASILTLCLLVFFIFNPPSVLADEGTSTADTNPEDIETNLPPETILASFGGQTITLGEFNQLWEQVPEEYKLQLDKSMVLDQMISEALLIQEAKTKKLEEDEKVAEQIKKMTEQILVQALIQKDILDKVQVNDEEVEKYYETNKDNFTEKEQAHLFNILVKTEEEAQDILKQLNAGEDFSEIAKTKSTGPSATQGGDMGFISKGAIIPEIDKAVFALEIGELTDIIKSDYGFHILKVTEKKPESTKSLEEAKEDIIQTLLPEKQKKAFENFLEELKGKTEIEINEDALK